MTYYTLILIVFLIPSFLSVEYSFWWLPISGIFPGAIGLFFKRKFLVNLALVFGCTSYLFVNRHLTFGLFELFSILSVLLLFFLTWRILEMWDLSSKIRGGSSTISRAFQTRYLKHLFSAVLTASVLTIIGLFIAIYGITVIPYGSKTYTIFSIFLTITFVSLIRLLVYIHHSPSTERLFKGS